MSDRFPYFHRAIQEVTGQRVTVHGGIITALHPGDIPSVPTEFFQKYETDDENVPLRTAGSIRRSGFPSDTLATRLYLNPINHQVYQRGFQDFGRRTPPGVRGSDTLEGFGEVSLQEGSTYSRINHEDGFVSLIIIQPHRERRLGPRRTLEALRRARELKRNITHESEA